RLLHNPRFLFHLGFELSRAPPRITEEREDRRQRVGFASALLSADRLLIKFKLSTLLPFERRQHQLIAADRSAEENRNIREILRRRFGHQLTHVFIERPI